MNKSRLMHANKGIYLLLLSAAILSGCSQTGPNTSGAADTAALTTQSAENTQTSAPQAQGGGQPLELEVRFGDYGDAFTMHLYEDNDTAAAIVRHVGTSDWRLPVYERDDQADYSIMQYYDIPRRYEIPSNPEQITEVRAGEVYYSDPNRIVLFYHDAEIAGEYTPIGYFDVSDEFITAVEENPVLEGWGNKIINISRIR